MAKLKPAEFQIIKPNSVNCNRGKTEQNSKTEHEYRKPNIKTPYVKIN